MAKTHSLRLSWRRQLKTDQLANERAHLLCENLSQGLLGISTRTKCVTATSRGVGRGPCARRSMGPFESRGLGRLSVPLCFASEWLIFQAPGVAVSKAAFIAAPSAPAEKRKQTSARPPSANRGFHKLWRRRREENPNCFYASLRF